MSIEDAQKWASVLKSNEEFIRNSLALGKTQKGRVLFLDFQWQLHDAARHRVLGDIAAVRSALSEALSRFSVLMSAPDVDPEWLRQALVDAACVAVVLKDELRVDQALAGAQRLMKVDMDGRDFFAAALAACYQGNRTAVDRWMRVTQEREGRYSDNLWRALQGAIGNDTNEFTNAMIAAVDAFNSDIAAGGQGSLRAAIFVPGAALLALGRQSNLNLMHPVFTDQRLLPDLV